jgi:ubiquinone/menaquinone biosynthesis C-methylase UbiE
MKEQLETKNIFEEIDNYWSEQRNNEIYLRGKDVERGSDEYWNIIESGRLKYIYYLPKILTFFRNGIGTQLLEVGCGMGIDLGYFINQGFKGTGIDLAQEHLRLAQEFFINKKIKANLFHQNAESLRFPENQFDCVYSLGVLHHTENPQKGIDEIYRVLRPHGRCAVMLYHKYSLNNLIHMILKIPYDNVKDRRIGGKDANFVYRFSRAEVKKLFQQFSNVNIHVEYLYGAGWEPIYSWTPKWIYNFGSKFFGWHLLILAEK